MMTPMYALGVDPGPVTSGVVRLGLSRSGPPGTLGYHHYSVQMADHAAERGSLRAIAHGFHSTSTLVAVEGLTSYGSVVGATTWETAYTVGYVQRLAEEIGAECVVLTRPDVALALVGSRRSTDAQIHEACRDVYRRAGLATGGGADPTKGTKAQPGPLYQVKSHAWDALAVALAAMRERGLV